MFSVRLREIPRTTSFRVALLFLLLFGATSLALFGYIYWQTAGYLSSQIDATLTRQTSKYSQMYPSLVVHEIIEHQAHDAEGRYPQSVFDAQGQKLGGMLDALPEFTAYDHAFEFRPPDQEGKRRRLRGMVHRLPDGRTVLVAANMHDIREFDELLLRALESGGAIMLAIGLLGATAMGLSAGRRLDGVTHAIERIVKGDLSKRLPLQGSKDDVDRLASVVNNMLDEIERLMHEVKGVCDDVAHDLRTPLTRLLAGLERAERRDLSELEYKEAITEAIEQARGLLVTFRALLRISEIEDSARRTGFVRIDLQQIVADAADFFEPLAEEKEIHLHYATPSEPLWITGDADLLFDALSNLVDNALKFTAPGGTVFLSLRADTQEATLSVSDNGPGIPEAEREAVLRRFYRSERSRHTAGNGLGLSLVAAVARLHDMQLLIRDAAPGCEVVLNMRLQAA